MSEQVRRAYGAWPVAQERVCVAAGRSACAVKVAANGLLIVPAAVYDRLEKQAREADMAMAEFVGHLVDLWDAAVAEADGAAPEGDG